MSTRSPLPTPSARSIGGAAVHFRVQLAIGVGALLPGLGGDVDERLLIAARREMAVDRVVAEVGVPADEPARERRPAVVEHLLERLVPVDELRLLRARTLRALRSSGGGNPGMRPCRSSDCVTGDR